MFSNQTKEKDKNIDLSFESSHECKIHFHQSTSTKLNGCATLSLEEAFTFLFSLLTITLCHFPALSKLPKKKKIKKKEREKILKIKPRNKKRMVSCAV